MEHNRTQPQASSVYKLTCCVMSKCSTESIIGYAVLLSLGNFATITVCYQEDKCISSATGINFCFIFNITAAKCFMIAKMHKVSI